MPRSGNAPGVKPQCRQAKRHGIAHKQDLDEREALLSQPFGGAVETRQTGKRRAHHKDGDQTICAQALDLPRFIIGRC